MRSEALGDTTGGALAPTPAAEPGVPVRDPLVRLVHRGVAGAVRLNATVIDAESAAHEIIGYGAVGRVAARPVWGLIGPRHARISVFPPNPLAALRHIAGLIRGRRTVHLSQSPAGAAMVCKLWATILGMGVTGYMMGPPQDFGMGWVEEPHEALFAWLMMSVGLHRAGIVVVNLATRVNPVRGMLDGRKRLPPGSDGR